jgi:hypothetical protein
MASMIMPEMPLIGDPLTVKFAAAGAFASY